MIPFGSTVEFSLCLHSQMISYSTSGATAHKLLQRTLKEFRPYCTKPVKIIPLWKQCFHLIAKKVSPRSGTNTHGDSAAATVRGRTLCHTWGGNEQGLDKRPHLRKCFWSQYKLSLGPEQLWPHLRKLKLKEPGWMWWCRPLILATWESETRGL